ncbi:MAG: GntR family transcriptional regulator, partial [Oxalobacteraceae bacterium]
MEPDAYNGQFFLTKTMKILPKRVVARRESIYEQILPKIRQDIVEGRWKPGQRLPEPLLCDEFGVSRTPLRDTFRVLESEGLLKLIPLVGAVVTKPDDVDISGTFELLAVLEGLAGETIARNRPAAVLAKLQKICEKLQLALEKNDHVLYFKLNDDFHRALALGSRNPTLIQLHENLMWHVYRLRHSINASSPFSRETGTGEEHGAIMAAIETGNAREAFELVRAHMQHVGANVLAATDKSEPLSLALAAVE